MQSNIWTGRTCRDAMKPHTKPKLECIDRNGSCKNKVPRLSNKCTHQEHGWIPIKLSQLHHDYRIVQPLVSSGSLKWNRTNSFTHNPHPVEMKDGLYSEKGPLNRFCQAILSTFWSSFASLVTVCFIFSSCLSKSSLSDPYVDGICNNVVFQWVTKESFSWPIGSRMRRS